MATGGMKELRAGLLQQDARDDYDDEPTDATDDEHDTFVIVIPL